jgi:hypothetical protein
MADDLTPNPPFLQLLSADQASARAALGLPPLQAYAAGYQQGVNGTPVCHPGTWNACPLDTFESDAGDIPNPTTNPALPAGPWSWAGIFNGLGAPTPTLIYTAPVTGWYAISLNTELSGFSTNDEVGPGIAFNQTGSPAGSYLNLNPDRFGFIFGIPSGMNVSCAARLIVAGTRIVPIIFGSPSGGGAYTIDRAMFQVSLQAI